MHNVRQAIQYRSIIMTQAVLHSKFLIDNLVFKNIMVTQSLENARKRALTSSESDLNDDTMVQLIATLTLMERIVTWNWRQ